MRLWRGAYLGQKRHLRDKYRNNLRHWQGEKWRFGIFLAKMAIWRHFGGFRRGRPACLPFCRDFYPVCHEIYPFYGKRHHRRGRPACLPFCRDFCPVCHEIYPFYSKRHHRRGRPACLPFCNETPHILRISPHICEYRGKMANIATYLTNIAAYGQKSLHRGQTSTENRANIVAKQAGITAQGQTRRSAPTVCGKSIKMKFHAKSQCSRFSKNLLF